MLNKLNHSITQNGHRHHSNHRHYRRQWRKIAWWIGGTIAVIALFFFGVAWRNVKTTVNAMYTNPQCTDTKTGTQLLSQRKPVSFLLVGNNFNGNDQSRGKIESILVMTVNPQTKSTTVVSVPRDMKVGNTTMNGEFKQGGMNALANSVQDKLNVPLHFFLEINFPGLERSVDQLGGIDVTAPVTSTHNNTKFVQGQTYHLTGKDLANYILADDQHENALTREKQELSTVMAMLKKSASFETLYNQQFLQSLSTSFQTNLSFNDITNLAKNYQGSTANLKEDYLHTTDNDNDEGQVIVSNAELHRNANLLQDNLK